MSRLQSLPARTSVVSQPAGGASVVTDSPEEREWPTLQNRLDLMQRCFPQPVSSRLGRAATSTPLKVVTLNLDALIAARLDAWLAAAPADEHASRLMAAEKIREAHRVQAACLNLDHLELHSLPDCLSALSALKILKLRGNQLTSLPTLPSGLLELKAGSNQLKSLPRLPAGLKELSVYRNALKRLPAMPPGLLRLHVYENNLLELQELPLSLERLLASNNALRVCPGIHDALSLVNLSDNPLSGLPSALLQQINGLSNSAELIRQYQRQSTPARPPF